MKSAMDAAPSSVTAPGGQRAGKGRTASRFRASVIRILILCQVGFMLLLWYRPLLHLQGPAPEETHRMPPGYRPLSAPPIGRRAAASQKRPTWAAEKQPEAGASLEDLGVRLKAKAERGAADETREAATTEQAQRPAVAKEQEEGQGSMIAASGPVAMGQGEAVKGAAFKPVVLDESKWLFFVRIQKTGSETLWKSLLTELDGTVWGRTRACPNGYFCGHKCQDTVERFMEAFEAGEERCKLLVRGHIGVYDYESAARRRGVSVEEDLVLFTMLRDPVKRVMSEYIHVTRNLPSQFGRHAYGRAWDYNYTGPADDFTAFLECQACQVGVSNRQTRMLAGLSTTGEPWHDEEEMLQRALANLERMAFVGVMERYQDSMLLLKLTFPEQLKHLKRYAYSRHPHDGSSQRLRLTEEQLERVRSLNRLDDVLYERALRLFEDRWREMRARHWQGQDAEPRFVQQDGRMMYVLKPVKKAKLEQEGEWTRPKEDYGVAKRGGDDDDDDDSGDQPSEGKAGAVSRGELASPAAQAAKAAASRKGRAPRAGMVPPTIQEYENFRDVIATTDIPLCRPTRIESPADFVVVPPPERAEDTERPYGVQGSAIGKLKSVTISTVRQLCLADEACLGFVYHAANSTATLLGRGGQGDGAASSSSLTTSALIVGEEGAVQVLPEEQVYRRTGEWDNDPLLPHLDRYTKRGLLQLASSRDTQFDAYGGLNPALRCRVLLPRRLRPGSDVRYEVYEPVNGISKYEMIAKLDHVGPWRAMQACRALSECAGFSLVVRDGHAYLFRLLLPDHHPAAGQEDGKGELVTINLRMREPFGNGGDGTFRLYVKVAAEEDGGGSSSKKKPVGNLIREDEIQFSPYAFTKAADTKLPAAPVTPRPAGVVVSLTTIPSRVQQLEDTLLSLSQQTRPPDRILVAMPVVSAREGGKPYAVPEWMTRMERVEVLQVEHDYGPATKLIPAVQHLKQQAENHLVLVVDDDTHYPPRLIETLLRWHEHLPHAALSFRGWTVHQSIAYLSFSDSYIVFGNEVLAPHPVSVLTANCGYLVQTAFFDFQTLSDFSGAPDGARWMDDVWINGQLARAGVPRLVVPFDEHQNTYNSYFPGLTLDTIRLRSSPKYQQPKRANSAREAANNQALSYFYSDWDVLWKQGYRVYSDVLGIPPVESPRITSSFRGVNRKPAGRKYEDEDGPVTGSKKKGAAQSVKKRRTGSVRTQ